MTPNKEVSLTDLLMIRIRTPEDARVVDEYLHRARLMELGPAVPRTPRSTNAFLFRSRFNLALNCMRMLACWGWVPAGAPDAAAA